jgi:xanthine dehydrogenase accessory factor
VGRKKTEPITAAEAAERALAALEGGAPVALVTVVAAPTEDAVGWRLAVAADSVDGTLGPAELDEQAVDLARESLARRESRLHEVERPDGVWRLYVESHHASPELVIVGAGHIGRALCWLGAMLGFRVTVLDDRPAFADATHVPEADRVIAVDLTDPFRDVAIGPDTYVVLVTRGHKYDYDCILKLLELEARPAYVGMIGSRRRVRAAFEALVRDGVDPERLAEIRAPIGLDIGAETPEEIALSIAAEIVAARRGGTGGPLSAREGVLDRVARSTGPDRNGG